MRRVGFLLIVLALVAGCDDDNPNGPTSGAIVFTATLSPANEVPPITNAEVAAVALSSSPSTCRVTAAARSPGRGR